MGVVRHHAASCGVQAAVEGLSGEILYCMLPHVPQLRDGPPTVSLGSWYMLGSARLAG